MVRFTIKLLFVGAALARCRVLAAPMTPSDHEALFNEYYGPHAHQVRRPPTWRAQSSNTPYQPALQAQGSALAPLPPQLDASNQLPVPPSFHVPPQDELWKHDSAPPLPPVPHGLLLDHYALSLAAISAPGPPNLDDFEPRELDQADFDFLHSLANEPPLPPHDPVHSLVNENPLPSHEPRPAPSIPEREAFSSSAVSAYPAVEQNLEPFPASAAWVDPRWDRSFRHRREATRSNVGWAAPRELLGLGHWKGLKEHGFSHARDFADTLATRARINELFFANKITWVDLRPFTRRNSQWFHRSPLVRVSQRLPLVRIVGKDGLPRRVYVTEHNVVTNRGSELKGTALDGVPFFSFWSVPEREADKEHETLFLGSGYLHARDNDAVDEHLRRVLEAAEPVEIRI